MPKKIPTNSKTYYQLTWGISAICDGYVRILGANRFFTGSSRKNHSYQVNSIEELKEYFSIGLWV